LGGDPPAEGFADERERAGFPFPQEFAQEIHPGLDAIVDERLVRAPEAELVERQHAVVRRERHDAMAPVTLGAAP
jgi:hypothetical protein